MPYRPAEIAVVTKALNGSPQYLGTIVATTTKNNHDTASPFNDGTLGGVCLCVQPDAACYILAGTANTATVTSSNGVKLGADERLYLWLKDSEGWLACVSVSGTTNLKVWKME
jgi:hypothetical protein